MKRGQPVGALLLRDKRSVFFLLTVVLLGAWASADLLQYQARLTNPGTGAPLEGTFAMTFRLYEVEVAGSPLWTEAKDVEVSKGLLGTLLGDTVPLPVAVFDGRALWLGVQVGTDEEASPRQRIVPVAYALHAANALQAANAQQLDGNASADYALKSEVFNIVLDQDGPGSGLNADLLDNQNSTFFAQADHNHDAAYVNTTGPDAMTGSSGDSLLTVTQSGAGPAGTFISPTTNALIGVTEVGAGNNIAGVVGRAGEASTQIVGRHGVRGETDSGRGVVGVSDTGTGVFGWSSSGTPVEGQTNSESGIGVVGTNFSSTGSGIGIRGRSQSTAGVGVFGEATASSGNTHGVRGSNQSTNNGAGVRGDSKYVGVWGATTEAGTASNWALYGAAAQNGYGIYATVAGGGTGQAGRFIGPVSVSGTLTKSSGSFKIDHPLDPENKYLYHSFVESPDMMNIYNGTTVLDAGGEAWIDLPEYFDVLNRDFRYQLTAIGAPAPNLHIASEVADNRFQIAGGPAGLKVSWQVTGVRQDPYAVANPIVVEQDKPEVERGTYLHPEVYGLKSERSLDAHLAPQSLE